MKDQDAHWVYCRCRWVESTILCEDDDNNNSKIAVLTFPSGGLRSDSIFEANGVEIEITACYGAGMECEHFADDKTIRSYTRVSYVRVDPARLALVVWLLDSLRDA